MYGAKVLPWIVFSTIFSGNRINLLAGSAAEQSPPSMATFCWALIAVGGIILVTLGYVSCIKYVCEHKKRQKIKDGKMESSFDRD